MNELLNGWQESFSLYLALGLVFSFLSVWAAIKAVRIEAVEKERRSRR
jgi:hypothetical protein